MQTEIPLIIQCSFQIPVTILPGSLCPAQSLCFLCFPYQGLTAFRNKSFIFVCSSFTAAFVGHATIISSFDMSFQPLCYDIKFLLQRKVKVNHISTRGRVTFSIIGIQTIIHNTERTENLLVYTYPFTIYNTST